MTKTGREPIITADRPAWHYEEPVTGRLMTYTTGYVTDEFIPCLALFAGGSNTPVVIPEEVLVHAIELRKAADKKQGQLK